MFIIEKTSEKNKFNAYYISSSPGNQLLEKDYVRKFLHVVSPDIGTSENLKLIKPSKRYQNSYDTGIYLIKYIEELMTTGELTSISIPITNEMVQEFRKE